MTIRGLTMAKEQHTTTHTVPLPHNCCPGNVANLFALCEKLVPPSFRKSLHFQLLGRNLAWQQEEQLPRAFFRNTSLSSAKTTSFIAIRKTEAPRITNGTDHMTYWSTLLHRIQGLANSQSQIPKQCLPPLLKRWVLLVLCPKSAHTCLSLLLYSTRIAVSIAVTFPRLGSAGIGPKSCSTRRLTCLTGTTPSVGCRRWSHHAGPCQWLRGLMTIWRPSRHRVGRERVSGDPRSHVCQTPNTFTCVSPCGSISGPFRVHFRVHFTCLSGDASGKFSGSISIQTRIGITTRISVKTRTLFRQEFQFRLLKNVRAKVSERSDLRCVADSADAFGDTHTNAFGDTHVNAFGLTHI